MKTGTIPATLIVGTAVVFSILGAMEERRSRLDRVQAEFESNNDWDQGRGYNWPEFRKKRTLRCTDLHRSLRYCTVEIQMEDPITRLKGLQLKELVCSDEHCVWIADVPLP